jgi:hypothetical protein
MMMETTGSERRQYLRTALRCRVQYIHDDGLFADCVEDISEGGLRLGGTTKLPLRQQVKLFLPVPVDAHHDRDALCLLQGEVIWRGGGSTGVRFVEPSPESLRQIREYVRRASFEAKRVAWSKPLC